LKEISIVIPVYNSEDNLEELNRQIDDALGTIEYELVLVNDHSKDKSWDKIVELKKINSNIKGINLRKNSGQDNAIMAGLNNSNGKYIVIMDDDLQHSPYDIDKLYTKIKEGYDICFANFKKKQQAAWKNLGSWFNGKLAEIMINKPKEIYLSPFKIFSSEILHEILKIKTSYPYLDGLLLSVTDSMTQIDIEHHKRFKGGSNYNLIKSISVLMKLVTSFSVTPLRLSSFIGFIVSVISFLLGMFFILDYSINGVVVEGWTSTIVIILFMGGLNLLSLGMVGEYLGRTYLNINNKPTFIIKEII
jgi:undecaprenyl-phosphate 4-deoxy-4-formamido-L-arabinose transferase